MTGLDAFFAPRTVAVIGASRTPGKLGHEVLAGEAHRRFTGTLIGVNPATDGAPIGGWPVVRSLGEIDGPVDLAFVALPAGATPAAVAECAAAGVRAAVLPAAGFGELGGEAAGTEAAMGAAARAAGLRLLGPNGIGLYVGRIGLNLMAWRDVPVGDVALVTQSGNVAIALSRLLARAGLGLSSCAGVGNQLDVTVAELVRHHARSGDSRAVAVYVEGARDGAARDLAGAVAACRDAGKPVVVLKGGRSAAGVTAAATHTGALGGGRLWDAALAGAGAAVVRSPEEMVDALLAAPARAAAGRGVLVLTDGGGDTVLTLDALDDAHVPLARLSPATVETLDALTPPAAPRAAGANPVTLDTAGGLEDDPRLLGRCAEIGAADAAVGALVVAGTFGGYRSRRAEELVAVDALVAVRDRGTPVLVHSAFALDDDEPLRRLRAAGIPVYPTARRLAEAIRQPPGEATPRPSPPGRLLPTLEVAALLRGAGIPVPPLRLLHSPGDVDDLDRPLCLKVEDPGIAHKSDVGGVIVGGPPAEAAAELWARFPGRPLLAMPVLEPGVEVLVGAGQDPAFGPFVTVGRGGVTAELDADVATALAPIDPAGAGALWRSLRCAPLLAGWRGRAGVDLDSLGALTVALGHLVAGDASLTIECNPVLAYPDGCAVADLRATREEPHAGP